MSNKNLADILKDIKNTTSQYNNLGGYKTCDSGCKLSLIKGGPLMLGGGNYLDGKWKDWRKTFDSSNSNSYKIQLALFDVPKFNYSVRYVDLPFRFEDWHAAHNYAKEQFGGLKFQIMGSRDAAHWHKSGLDKKENNDLKFKDFLFVESILYHTLPISFLNSREKTNKINEDIAPIVNLSIIIVYYKKIF